jgi:hypothetical protein
VLPIGAPALTLIVSIKVAEVLAAKLDRLHVTVPVPPDTGVPQAHPLGGLIDTKVVLGGSTSATLELAAEAGPLLVAMIV